MTYYELFDTYNQYYCCLECDTCPVASREVVEAEKKYRRGPEKCEHFAVRRKCGEKIWSVMRKLDEMNKEVAE